MAANPSPLWYLTTDSSAARNRRTRPGAFYAAQT